ncbi:sensor histidine kinase [Microbacterium karelineae]|uniref:sensor histidine kinase n=1 Tax=Microbacterium karelineae TaxID=2654283 RepID=UPI0018D2E1CF|nr:histidine kinase [Microbacterium karelineae]
MPEHARSDHAPTPDGVPAPPARKGALSRWATTHPRAVWYSISSTIAVVLYAVAAPVGAVIYEIPVGVALALPLAQVAALVAIRRYPWVAIVVFAVAGGAESLSMADGAMPWPWNVTMMIGFVFLTGATWTLHDWRRGLAAYLLPGVAITLPIIGSFTASSLPSAIVALAVGLLASVIGWILSDRIRMAGRLTREREVSQAETERRLVAEERQRIAREMHDVVAHGLSLIQVQATSAPYRVSDAGPEASAEFSDIARAARESLGEMRRLLGALRGDDEAGERAPQPTLDDLARLVSETERAGADIGLSMAPPDPVPAPVGVAAYRIVQEAISNAVRHAPGSRIDVAVGGAGADALLIEVQNAPAPEAADPAARGSGHGLVGMRERAGLLRGSLQAGPTAAGGFRVAASLPLAEEEAA